MASKAGTFRSFN